MLEKRQKRVQGSLNITQSFEIVQKGDFTKKKTKICFEKQFHLMISGNNYKNLNPIDNILTNVFVFFFFFQCFTPEV
jgi:hypothetical protein